ncbi:MAG: hypothetical protein EWV80_00285 [Microcystis aeruginosa Ma_QC_B_20070730_S2]|jgi:hypothetical protein|uniref:Uncharacterized protein n=1 Tax=Microcystis aeruginosa Ma_QC_B_20070730_S2 TaxID=2486256 RepID=A0A552EB13_MICAE|nr:MAG: hypothetical protein EWV80_00285 [Microcystis aeruginosa Ma_QC_B_20070730_S2]
MALTPEEKRRIIKFLDEADRSFVEIILASLEAFRKWLSDEFNKIYLKVKDGLQNLWQSVRNVFS